MRTFFILLVLLSATLFSCTSHSSEKNHAKATDLQEIIANPADYIDQDLQVEGTVTHVCRHGGQKMFLKPKGSSQTMKITAGSDIAEFGLELEGSKVSVTGILREGTEETTGLPGTKNEGMGGEHEHESDTMDHPSEQIAATLAADTCENETSGLVYWIEARKFDKK